MIDSILAAFTVDAALSGEAAASTSLSRLLIALGAALALGCLVGAAYWLVQRRRRPPAAFALILALLPPTIAAIILLVGANIASAFSLSGAFSLIRFRSTPGDPKDIVWVLFCMAVGLAAGLGYPLYALIIALALTGAMVLLEGSRFGAADDTGRVLRVTIPENLDYGAAFADLLPEYTRSANLVKVKTAELGSLFVLEYAVVLKADDREKSFIDALRCRNGNLPISLYRDAAEKD